MPSPKEVLSTAHVFFSIVQDLLKRSSGDITMVIEEFDGRAKNQIYKAAEIYLRSKITPSTKRLRVSKHEKENNFKLTMERNKDIVDVLDDVQFKWRFMCRQVEKSVLHDTHDLNASVGSEIRSFELSFHKKYKEKVLGSYFPYIINESNKVKEENKTLKLYTVTHEKMNRNKGDIWSSINLDHPATFATLAMESKLKKEIMEDLERFVKREEYYRRVGKAWKRGYLIYGPSGTGKSSLIAAMANYLNFDIYDLELTEVPSNSELRRILMSIANRSILVIEDIDEIQDRLAKAQTMHPSQFQQESQLVTLSGLLNFIDGLWSSCGDERIIVFTTNHKDRLDHALFHHGSMNMRIHMSYCTPCGFKLLTSNYLGIHDHPLFEEIEELIEKVDITPAEVAEQLMKGDEAEMVLRNLIEFLRKTKIEHEEVKALKEEKRTESEK